MTHRRRGNALVSTLLLVTLAGFAALVVDIGYGRTVHYQLEAAADAAVHAAAPFLDGTEAGVASARASAFAVAAANQANGSPVALAEADVVTGIWSGGSFTPSTSAEVVNAVKVTARANLSAFFGQVAFGVEEINPSASAIAVMPATDMPGSVDCFLPFAVPLCALQAHPAGTLASIDFQFSVAGVDNSAWGTLVANPSSIEIRGFLNNCEAQGAARVGDSVNVNNGEVSSGLQEIANVIEGSATRWDPATLGTQPDRMTQSAVSASGYGGTLEGPILVFDQGNVACDSISYVQGYPLVGFAWGVVYDVRAAGGAKTIKLRINNNVAMDYGTSGGGAVDAGVIYQPAAMVVQ
ncbi:MAG: TadG family pilus assembly protein [Pseudomonadota bacterium]|nr:TadG family pilus assembly protein [Pseudomonadota bacterium]